MEILKTILISAIQGVTEFLPVSSSGHIVLFKSILGLDIDATFDVFIHMGTLIAVLVFYRNEIYDLIRGLFAKKIDSDLFGKNIERKDILRIWALFIIATIPGGIVGIFLEKPLDLDPSSMQNWMFLLLMGLFMITGIFLLSTMFIKNNNKNIKDMNVMNAITIGIFQAFAILPGISRSGSTITASFYTGLNKRDAAGFSFILSIPLIGAAFLLKVFKLIQSQEIADIKLIGILLIGMIVSFIFGYISLRLLINLLKKGKFWVFSLYLIIPSVISLILWLTWKTN